MKTFKVGDKVEWVGTKKFPGTGSEAHTPGVVTEVGPGWINVDTYLPTDGSGAWEPEVWQLSKSAYVKDFINQQLCSNQGIL